MSDSASNGVWKMMATALFGVAIGGAAAMGFAAFQTNAIVMALRDHERIGGHPLVDARVTALEAQFAALPEQIRLIVRDELRLAREGR